MSKNRVQIRLLGDFEVLCDGRPAELPPSRKTRALLAYLLLEPRPHRRERLCEMLWQVPDDPRGSLRWSLSKLRRLLNRDRERILADREQVRIDPSDVDVDFLDLQRELADGTEGIADDRLAGLAECLSAALLESLQLPGQPEFEAWRLGWQERGTALRRLCLRTLVERTGGSPTLQISWLRRLVEADPYNAGAHRQLIRTLAQTQGTREAGRQRDISARILREIDLEAARQLDGAIPATPSVRVTKIAAAGRALQQEIRFCTSEDGARIAYASVGKGPPLVKTANWLNHLEFDWESPVWRDPFQALAANHRLLRYDARGNGLSDWDATDFSLPSLVKDLEAVVDALQLERFPLLCLSQGCAVGIEYAYRHPERVSRLVLNGGFARGWYIAGTPRVRELGEAMVAMVRNSWGQDEPLFRQMFTSLMMPEAPADHQQWFNELQRVTTRPETAAELMRALGRVDVVDRLPHVRVPTLVLHSRHDKLAPHSAGREMAAGIPGARLVTLESPNHLIPRDDPVFATFIAEILAFIDAA